MSRSSPERTITVSPVKNEESEQQPANDDNDEDEEYEERPAKRKRVELAQEVLIGHYIDHPDVSVYGRITSARCLSCRISKEEGRAQNLIHNNGIVGILRVALAAEILNGQDQDGKSGEAQRRWLCKMVVEYLKEKLEDVPNEEPGPRQAGAFEAPSRAETLAEHFRRSRYHMEAVFQIQESIHEQVEGQGAENVGMKEDMETQKATIEDLEATVRERDETIRNLQAQNKNQEDIILDFRKFKPTPPIDQVASASSANVRDQSPMNIPSGPTKTSSGKFIIGDKIYEQVAPNLPNGGFFVEKEGKIKDGRQEKTILREHNGYKAAVTGETVMVKNIEFQKMANGDLLQKDEELVKIDGKTYVRCRTYVAYESDGE